MSDTCSKCGASLRDLMIANLRAAHPQLSVDDISAVVDFSIRTGELSEREREMLLATCAVCETRDDAARTTAFGLNLDRLELEARAAGLSPTHYIVALLAHALVVARAHDVEHFAVAAFDDLREVKP